MKEQLKDIYSPDIPSKFIAVIIFLEKIFPKDHLRLLTNNNWARLNDIYEQIPQCKDEKTKENTINILYSHATIYIKAMLGDHSDFDKAAKEYCGFVNEAAKRIGREEIPFQQVEIKNFPEKRDNLNSVRKNVHIRELMPLHLN